MEIGRFALFGPPGAGKSTVRRLSQQAAADLGFTVRHIRLADPLYAAQDAIYRLAGRTLRDPSVQDGRLLNLLGIEMRRINPDVLADHARAELASLGRDITTRPGPHAIVCDDMRPPDAPFLRELGFEFVRIQVDASATQDRRRRRGDLTLGSLDDPNELGVEELPATLAIDNTGDLDALTSAVQAFWRDRMR